MEKIIIVTGASQGLGKVVSEMLANDDNKIIKVARNIDLKDPMQYSCDVSDEKAVKEVVDDVVKRFGRVDLLINNAGYGMSGISELVSVEEMHRIFNVNFFGSVYFTKFALPHMQKNSRIINVGSAMEFFPLPYRAFYASSKSAIGTFSIAQRMECEQLGVDITVVCPGDIKTTFVKNRVKNFETDERYGDSIKKATGKVDAREDKRMSVEYVAKKIVKIANKRKTKPRYIIGRKYKVLHFLTKLFPFGLVVKAIKKMCG